MKKFLEFFGKCKINGGLRRDFWSSYYNCIFSNFVFRNFFKNIHFSSTTTTTAAPTTKPTAAPTTPTVAPTPTSTETPVDPSGRGGSKFDGWSFFGGILLTIGLSAIGFVSFKYYKVRSGGAHVGTNYNRF